MNIFLSVYIKKRRLIGATLRIFDVCNQEKRQVIWYTYLRNDALDIYNIANESLLSGAYYICISIRITINLVTLTPLQYR